MRQTRSSTHLYVKRDAVLSLLVLQDYVSEGIILFSLSCVLMTWNWYSGVAQEPTANWLTSHREKKIFEIWDFVTWISVLLQRFSSYLQKQMLMNVNVLCLSSGREYQKNDPAVTVDYNTADPVVRWDSYENFNQRYQDSLEGNTPTVPFLSHLGFMWSDH